MKKNQKIIGLISLALVSGCAALLPKVKEPRFSLGKPYTPPDLELTLIYKDKPQRYLDVFSRTELHFSTNKSQKTHAILNMHLCEDISEKIKSISLGQTMKESEWNRVLLDKKKCLSGDFYHHLNWQRFY